MYSRLLAIGARLQNTELYRHGQLRGSAIIWLPSEYLIQSETPEGTLAESANHFVDRHSTGADLARSSQVKRVDKWADYDADLFWYSGSIREPHLQDRQRSLLLRVRIRKSRSLVFLWQGFRADSEESIVKSKAVVLHIYRSDWALRSVRIHLGLREPGGKPHNLQASAKVV